MQTETRRHGRGRSRILYWFRTPPGVRIGRSALDEDAIRLIEQHNPGVEFDWTRILKGQDAPPEPKTSAVQERRPRQARPRDVPAPSAPPLRPAASAVELPPTPGIDTPARSVDPEASFVQPPEAAAEVPADAVSQDQPATPAVERLGFEGLSRLRARHAEVLARISEKVSDPVKRDQLKSEAERLNPDTWVTAAEVSAGLEGYESVFESLRGVVGRRRKRRRRRAGGPGDQPAGPAAGEEPAVGEPADESGEDV